MIVSREECHARGAAQRRGVEAIVLQTAASEPFERGCAHWPAERRAVAESEIVYQNNDDVGRALGRRDLKPRRRFGITRVEGGDGFVLRRRDRQHCAIWLGSLRLYDKTTGSRQRKVECEFGRFG